MLTKWTIISVIKMLTLLIYHILDLSNTAHKNALINVPAFFILIVTFTFDVFILADIIAYSLSGMLNYCYQKDKKYYANLNKTRYDQTNTRL